MSEPLFLAERRRIILDQLKSEGRVSVKGLSETLGVSAVTIRQDLRALESEGMVERTYGGAILAKDRAIVLETAFHVRQSEKRAEKNAICKAAAALIQPGYGIALDASTTVNFFAPHLTQLGALTIVTNSLVNAQQFLGMSQIQVLMPAGRLRRDSASLVGRPESIPDIHLNIGFFGARGLSLTEGSTELNPYESEMKQAVMKRCLKKIILVDSGKWGQVAPYSCASLDMIDEIITTENAPEAIVRQFREAGIPVETVPIG